MSQSVKTQKSQITLAHLYMFCFDAHVAHKHISVSDVAQYASFDVAKTHDQLSALESLSLIEMSESESAATRVITCDDAERISRDAAITKYKTLVSDAENQRMLRDMFARAALKSESAAESASETVKRDSDAAAAAAQRVITLAQYTDAKRNLITVTSARAAAFETQAIIEHRNEHKHDSKCVVCLQDYAHTTTIAISSRCYNHMRKATREVMHSTDSAVIRHMKNASEDQLTQAIEIARASLKITVTALSARAAAKLIKQSLDDNA